MKVLYTADATRHRRRPRRPRPHLGRHVRPRPRDAQGDGRRRRRDQPRAAVRGRLRGLLPLRAAAGRPPGQGRRRRLRGDGRGRHRPDRRRRLRPGRHARITCPASTGPPPQQLVEAAHQVCPYSNATRGNIDVDLTVWRRSHRDAPVTSVRSTWPPAPTAGRPRRTSASSRPRCPTPARARSLVRNLFMSVDPYMRGRMNDVKSYVPPFQLDAPARRRRGRRGRRVQRARRARVGRHRAARPRLARVRRCSTPARSRTVDPALAPAVGVPRRARHARPDRLRRAARHRRHVKPGDDRLRLRRRRRGRQPRRPDRQAARAPPG